MITRAFIFLFYAFIKNIEVFAHTPTFYYKTVYLKSVALSLTNHREISLRDISEYKKSTPLEK